MPGFLSDGATLYYNGVTFPSAINVRVQSQYIRDSAGRHIKYVRHSLTVEVIFHIADDSMGSPPNEPVIPSTTSLDATSTGFPPVRKALSQSGGTLKYTGYGFGDDFWIDTTIQDVAFGPTPEVLSWEPLGGPGAAIRCVWTVSVQIPEVQGGTGPQWVRLVEMNYAMSWDIAENGLTRRLINGNMELAVDRVGPRDFSGTHSVDFYRRNLRAEVPLGFSRVSQNWSLSTDHRNLLFSIVDSEIASDNPYYPGTIRPRVTHSLSPTGGLGRLSFQKWISTLSGSIEVAPGYPRWFAWVAFLIVLKKRMAADKHASLKQTSECPDPQAGIQIVQDISISEEVFGRSTSFSVAYMLTTDLKSLFKATGLWTINDEVTWASYRQSMESGGMWDPYGYAQMMHNHTDDAIVAFDHAAPQTITIHPGVNRGQFGESGEALLEQPCPPAARSWLVFENECELITNTNHVSHKTLQEPEQLNLLTPLPGQELPVNQSAETTPPITYRRSDTTYMVRLRGYAMRVCYEVPEMHLESYGGRDVILRPRDSDYGPSQTHRKLTTLHHPIYISRWDKQYIVLGTPSLTDSKGNLEPDCFGAK